MVNKTTNKQWMNEQLKTLILKLIKALIWYIILVINYYVFFFLGGGQFFVILYLSFVLCHYIWLFFFIFL